MFGFLIVKNNSRQDIKLNLVFSNDKLDTTFGKNFKNNIYLFIYNI